MEERKGKEYYLTTGRFKKLGKGYERCCGPTAITNLIQTLRQEEGAEILPSDEVFLSVAKTGTRRGIYVNLNLLGRFGGTSNVLSEPYIKTCLKKHGLHAELRYLGRLTGERLERAMRRGSYLYLQLLYHPKYGNHHVLCYGAERIKDTWKLTIADGWSARAVTLTLEELKRVYAIEVLRAGNGPQKEKAMNEQKIVWVTNPMRNENETLLAAAKESFSYEATEDVRALHQQVRAYSRTPLVELKETAKRGGVAAVLVKDESLRFGLKAFKGLGGVYAMFRMICASLALDPAKTTLQDLKSEEHAAKIADLVFITTTDGNHGKGVSWAAGLFGCKAHVFMPKGTVEVRAQAIRDAGSADVVITDMLYDDCVAYSARLAEENGWLLIQDTAWDGYTDVPLWIMQGYTTMLFEALSQMQDLGYERPTHVFLQAGVGAMAGGVAAGLLTAYPGHAPVISLVEPTQVACFYESLRRADGAPHMSTGNCETIMAGLNCAMPCTTAWEILRECTSYAFACEDGVTEHGMRLLGKPAGDDPLVVAGESGAVTTGLTDLLLTDPAYAALREEMGLDEKAVILLINTEGNTDPADYRRVMLER